MPVLESAEPTDSRGRIALEPEANRLHNKNVGETRDHGLAAGPSLPGFGGHQPECCLHPLRLCRSGRLEWMAGGKVSTRLRAAGWSKRTAPQISVIGAPPPPWRRISYRSLTCSRSRSRIPGARAPASLRSVCPSPCGDEREVPAPKHPLLRLAALEQDLARDRRVEPHVPRHRREREPPRRAELRPAIERTAHPHEMECLGERVRRSPGIDRVHVASVATISRSSSRSGRLSKKYGVIAIDRPLSVDNTGRMATRGGRHMARTGQTLVNPVSGERITFRTTAAESNGKLVAIELALPPGGRVPGPLHLHPLQEERFEVVEGRMRFRVERERVVAGPGEVVVVPPGAPHDFANDGDRAALVRVEIRPALKMEQLFETAVALAEQGRTMLGGVPKPARACPLHARVRAGSADGVPAALAPAARTRTTVLGRAAPRPRSGQHATGRVAQTTSRGRLRREAVVRVSRNGAARPRRQGSSASDVARPLFLESPRRRASLSRLGIQLLQEPGSSERSSPCRRGWLRAMRCGRPRRRMRTSAESWGYSMSWPLPSLTA